MTQADRGDSASSLQSDRTAVKRIAVRGAYDRETIYAILDEAIICQVGFVDRGQPFVIPTIHARMGDRLVFHGSAGSRLLERMTSGDPVCVSATLVDGLVLARSGFHHSMNYRSVVLLGRGQEVVDREEKLAALEAVSEHVIPGRWSEVRPVHENELNATRIVSMPIEEASAKIRNGPPKDDDEDYALPIWAGVIPLALRAGMPIPDPHLKAGIAVPSSVTEYLMTAKQ